MHSTTIYSAIAAILTLPTAHAFWRLPCVSPLVTERADPIVNPGAVSGHAHTIMGGNGFGFTMDYADTQSSTCSSCTVKKDFSNYWVPNVYYKGKDGKFTSVQQVGGGLIYYLQRSDPQDPEFSNGLLAFPEGFRMLAGNPMLRSFSDTLEQKAVSFACLGVSGPETHEFPKQNCPNGVRAQVFFPSCWDGKNLDSEDHKSHMAYPSNVDSGKCPVSHPKRLISIFYEVVWDTNKFKDMWYDGKQPFVLSTGDETGYGYHGDFVNGWDVAYLQRAVEECTAESGRVEDCPVFNNNLYENSFSEGCKIPPSIDEQIFGTMDALPGCNPTSGEGSNAKMATGCGAPTTISQPKNPFVDLTATKNFAYLGCGTDDISSRTLTGASTNSDDMTNEKCVDFCTSKGFTIAGTEYSTQCYCGNSISSDRAPIDGLMGDCFMKCGGDANDNCGGAGTISLYKECGGACENVAYGANTPSINNPAVPVPAPATTAKAATSKAVVGAAPAATSAKAAAGVVGVAPKPVVKAVDDNVEDVSPKEDEEDSTTIKFTTTSSIFVTLPVSTIASTKAAAGVAPANTIKAKCADAETVTVHVTIALSTVTVTAGSQPSEVAPPVVKIPAPVLDSTGDKAAAGDGQGSGKPSTGNFSPEPVEEDDTQDNSPVDIAPVISNPTTTINSPPVIPSLHPTGNSVPFGNSTRPGRGKGGAKHGHNRHSSDVSSTFALPTGAAEGYVKY